MDWIKTASGTSEQTAFQNALNAAAAHWNQFKGQYGVSEVFKKLNDASLQKTGSYIKKFARGGLSTAAGLAWLDGTPQNPERILSPYQTGLFEDLIASLHEIRINTPTVRNIAPKTSEPASTFHIETIQVLVEKLESDADYAEMARKVGEHIFEEMNRGLPVGGYRFRK